MFASCSVQRANLTQNAPIGSRLCFFLFMYLWLMCWKTGLLDSGWLASTFSCLAKITRDKTHHYPFITSFGAISLYPSFLPFFLSSFLPSFVPFSAFVSSKQGGGNSPKRLCSFRVSYAHRACVTHLRTAPKHGLPKFRAGGSEAQHSPACSTSSQWTPCCSTAMDTSGCARASFSLQTRAGQKFSSGLARLSCKVPVCPQASWRCEGGQRHTKILTQSSRGACNLQKLAGTVKAQALLLKLLRVSWHCKWCQVRFCTLVLVCGSSGPGLT